MAVMHLMPELEEPVSNPGSMSVVGTRQPERMLRGIKGTITLASGDCPGKLTSPDSYTSRKASSPEICIGQEYRHASL